MRENLECAVLMVSVHEAWMSKWIDAQRNVLRKIRLQPYFFDTAFPRMTHAGDLQRHEHNTLLVLANAAMALRRFDMCILPVSSATLGWTRTALACACHHLRTPVLGLTQDLKAPALHDLLELGLRDFVFYPVSSEELQVRLTLLTKPVSAIKRHYSSSSSKSSISTLKEPHFIYGKPSTERPRLSRTQIEQAVLILNAAPRLSVNEPFQQAKSRIVNNFEQAYLRLALSHHGGNVARAARASSKHRRAFWALMRKHCIDARPFRRVTDESTPTT